MPRHNVGVFLFERCPDDIRMSAEKILRGHFFFSFGLNAHNMKRSFAARDGKSGVAPDDGPGGAAMRGFLLFPMRFPDADTERFAPVPRPVGEGARVG